MNWYTHQVLGWIYHHMIYHKNHSTCYYLTSTSELESTSSATFFFDTKFVLCKDRHLHIPKHRMPDSEEETPPVSYEMKVSASVHVTNDLVKMTFAPNKISKCKKKKQIL